MRNRELLTCDVKRAMAEVNRLAAKLQTSDPHDMLALKSLARYSVGTKEPKDAACGQAAVVGGLDLSAKTLWPQQMVKYGLLGIGPAPSLQADGGQEIVNFISLVWSRRGYFGGEGAGGPQLERRGDHYRIESGAETLDELDAIARRSAGHCECGWPLSRLDEDWFCRRCD